jgi:hypothetical protein
MARVAQEALSNVARHARATLVSVSLGAADGRLTLTVRDNGRGFSEESRPQGMGMANIAARASEVGGTFEAVSAPDAGTTVRFSVPCEQIPSARPYAVRAAVWAAALAVIVALSGRFGFLARPWLTVLLLIAAIAVTRYVVATYWLVRRTAG